MVQESSKFVKDRDSETKKVTFAPFDVSRFLNFFFFNEHQKSKMLEEIEVLLQLRKDDLVNFHD